MLFLCAWLFFLFGTPVLSIPVHPGSSTPATSQEHEIQRATSTPEDGYWVLKRPQQSHGYPERILHISNGLYRVFTVNNEFKRTRDPMEVIGMHKLGLVGDYTRIPTLGTPPEHLFLELRINPDERQPENIVLQLLDTRTPDRWNPPDGWEVTNDRQTKGYWVLGDVTPSIVSRYEILHANNGVYQTFQLNDDFITNPSPSDPNPIIDASTRNGINLGRYFRIPVVGDGTLPFQRFDILTHARIRQNPGYSLKIFNQEENYVNVWHEQ